MRSSSLRRAVSVVFAFVVAALLSTQALTEGGYAPKAGQAGKDVIWLPTEQSAVDTMLDLAKLTPQDYLIDLGSGDGRVVIAAAKRGARALGVEYNPEMVDLSKRNAAKAGVADKTEFVRADLFKADLGKATVITMFLLPDLNLRLRPRILDLKPGTRIISNSFEMGEWEPDESATANDECSAYCTAYLWLVPARVEGTWKLPKGDLVLKQNFQVISGTLSSGTGPATPIRGQLRGDQLRFVAAGARYTGRVDGNSIEGTMKDHGTTAKWNATKVGAALQAAETFPSLFSG